MKRVLVTGGAGYIGSHIVKLLCDNNYEVFVLDNLSRGYLSQVDNRCKLIVGDISQTGYVTELLTEEQFDAVIHCAAYAYVGESMKHPASYYVNNVAGTLSLLEAMLSSRTRRILFSSTCAVYGNSDEIVDEECDCRPESPYGASKLMVEQILDDYATAYGIQPTVFRFFNAAGQHPDGSLTESHSPETHLIPLALAARQTKRPMRIYGDGESRRDYVHVCDIAMAHLLALQSGVTGTYNLATGNSYSVNEVLDAIGNVPHVHVSDRSGDARHVDTIAALAEQKLGWLPQFDTLESILATL
jgi:UDP-glucose 4-epimerase